MLLEGDAISFQCVVRSYRLPAAFCRRPPQPCPESCTRSVFGFATVPAKLYPWLLAAVWQVAVPQASLLGHLSGLAVGLLYCRGLLHWAMPPSAAYHQLERSAACARCFHSASFIAHTGGSGGDEALPLSRPPGGYQPLGAASPRCACRPACLPAVAAVLLLLCSLSCLPSTRAGKPKCAGWLSCLCWPCPGSPASTASTAFAGAPAGYPSCPSHPPPPGWPTYSAHQHPSRSKMSRQATRRRRACGWAAPTSRPTPSRLRRRRRRPAWHEALGALAARRAAAAAAVAAVVLAAAVRCDDVIAAVPAGRAGGWLGPSWPC